MSQATIATYMGWDAHAYSGLLREHPQLAKFRFPNDRNLTRKDADDLVMAILLQSHLNEQNRPIIQSMLYKMLTRWQITDTMSGYYDPDIGNVNIFMLLQDCWFRIWDTFSGDLSLLSLFVECLVDAGQTCVQGDSHRLALFYIAVCGDEKIPTPLTVNTSEANNTNTLHTTKGHE